jgi:hypothetical protein
MQQHPIRICSFFSPKFAELIAKVRCFASKEASAGLTFCQVLLRRVNQAKE